MGEQKQPQEGTLTAEDILLKGIKGHLSVRQCAEQYAAALTAALREDIGRLQTSKQEWADLAFKRRAELDKEKGMRLAQGVYVQQLKDELEAVKKELQGMKDDYHSIDEDGNNIGYGYWKDEYFRMQESASKYLKQRDEVTRQRDEAVKFFKYADRVLEFAFREESEPPEIANRLAKLHGGIQGMISRLTSGETKTVSPWISVEERLPERPVGSNTLNVLAVLSTLSPARSKAAFGLGVDEWSLPEWACALAGEVGELCNFIKKTNRDGLDRTEDIAKEAADVAIYLDLLCTRAGIDLQAAIVSKFNEVSDRMNCDIKFPAPPESLTDKK